MSEYWKSTPSYWCKFCSTYVKDTPLERKHHETSGKHQGAIQKNLRDLTKNKEREQREKQRAKDEVARLNGLVGGGKSSPPVGNASKGGIVGARDVTRGSAGGGGAPAVSSAAQRKAHAEQLIALGVAVPEELKREVTGVGDWQTVSSRVIEAPSTLAEIKAEEDRKPEMGPDGLSRGVRTRKREDDEDEGGEEVGRRKGWWSSVRRYPGADGGGGGEDLDALLSGVGRKVKKEESEEKVEVKRKEAEQDGTQPALAAAAAEVGEALVKREEDGGPAVVFKKRKVKR